MSWQTHIHLQFNVNDYYECESITFSPFSSPMFQSICSYTMRRGQFLWIIVPGLVGVLFITNAGRLGKLHCLNKSINRTMNDYLNGTWILIHTAIECISISKIWFTFPRLNRSRAKCTIQSHRIEISDGNPKLHSPGVVT